MSSVDNLSSSALWLIDQLSRPPDANEEHTTIYGQEDIAKEIGSAEGFEEYARLYRVLAWREKEHRGKILELELIEISRIKTRFNRQIIYKNLLPKTECSVRDLWERIMNALELPSTRLLLSEQAILIHADPEKVIIQVAKNWFNMVQSRTPLLEKAVAAVTGRRLRVQLEPIKFPEATKVIEDKTVKPSISHEVVISAYDPSEEKIKILSKIDISDEDADEINFLIKAWTHHGGTLDDLSGVPAYLRDQ